MPSVYDIVKALPLLSTGALASASYPAKPVGRTAPVQQREHLHRWEHICPHVRLCVEYGFSEHNLDHKVCSLKLETYTTSRTWFNYVTLEDLKPATIYYYMIVSRNSTVNQFFTLCVAGDKTPFTVNAVIDLGVYSENGFTIANDHTKRDSIPDIPPSLNHTTIKRLADTVDDYEFIIHPGDFAILEQFYDQLAPISAPKPYMAKPENHEAACLEIPYMTGQCPNGQKNFTYFISRFGEGMPTVFASTLLVTEAKVKANTAQMLSNPPFWLSFEYGMAHVVMFNTETDFQGAPDTHAGSSHLEAGPFGRPEQQMQFLEADLASVDHSVTPWLIAAGHRPWHTSGDGAVCKSCQDALEAVLYRYGVDLAVFGHVHNLQRMLPVYNNTADPAGLQDLKAPMYIVTGSLGNIEGTAKLGSPLPYSAFGYDEDFSYASITFADEQNLEISFYRSATGEVLDRSTLLKSHREQFVAQTPP